MDDRDTLRAEVLSAIRSGFERPLDSHAFERLALRVWRRQFADNEPYRRYCERVRRTPDFVSRWIDIPAVPAAAFKETALTCGDPDSAEAVFRTSGTSQGTERRGAHYVSDLTVYRASALPNFHRHMLPEGINLQMLILAPSPTSAPDSSLSWMFELVRAEFGTSESSYYVDSDGLDLESLIAALSRAELAGEPVFVLGTAAALAHAVEAFDESGRRFRVAPGSRVMETGGFKRRGRELPREQFYRMIVDGLGVSELYCVGEYGMTELCSQFYDNVLRDRSRGRSPEVRYKVVPPWVRVQVVDPETLEPVPRGVPGLLRHFDLANVDSVMAVQTDDMGVCTEGGFEIIGRARGAERRGCSIAMDEWLTAQR